MSPRRKTLVVLGLVLGAWAAVIGLGGLALLVIGAPFSVYAAALLGFFVLVAAFSVVSLIRQLGPR